MHILNCTWNSPHYYQQFKNQLKNYWKILFLYNDKLILTFFFVEKSKESIIKG